MGRSPRKRAPSRLSIEVPAEGSRAPTLQRSSIRALAQAHRTVPDDIVALLAVYAELIAANVRATWCCESCHTLLEGKQRAWCSDACRLKARRDAVRSKLLAHLGRPEAVASWERRLDAIAKVTELVGWRRVRLVIVNVLGHANGGRHGRWRYEIDEDRGPKVIDALRYLVAHDMGSEGDDRPIEALQLDVQ